MDLKHNFLALAIIGFTFNVLGQSPNVRPFQISLLPNIGTSSNPMERYTNHVSLNLLGGINEGVQGVELGGIFNLDDDQVTGVQIGGIANLVGGETRGVQMGGIINGSKGSVTGLQAAGITNLAPDVTGVQIGGINNINKNSTTGAQIGGLSNHSGSSVTGIQLAGISNFSTLLKGVQIAGIVNHAKEVRGVQFSGLINQAKSVNGLQFGLINIADTIEKGASFGLITIVRKGLHQLEFTTNDVTDFNLSFRSGTHTFYSILTAGIEAKSGGFWGYGAGFGSQFKINERFTGSVEVTSNAIQTTRKVTNKLSLDNRLSIMAGYQLSKHLTLIGGPVVHVYVAEPLADGGSQYGLPITDHSFFNKTSTTTNVKMWVGYQIGVRF